MSDQLKMELN